MDRAHHVTLAAALLAGCSPAQPTVEEDLVSRARLAIAATLKDPDSAKFRDVRAYPDKRLVCGEVNGKNSYGAYAGFSPFFYDNGFAQIADGVFSDRYDELCMGAIRDEGLAALNRTKSLIAKMEDGPEKDKIRADVEKLISEQAAIDEARN